MFEIKSCVYHKCKYIYIPGTQMTLVLIGKGLLLEGSTPKTKDKQVPGIYIYNTNMCCAKKMGKGIVKSNQPTSIKITHVGGEPPAVFHTENGDNGFRPCHLRSFPRKETYPAKN